jgi:hypothetical protein
MDLSHFRYKTIENIDFDDVRIIFNFMETHKKFILKPLFIHTELRFFYGYQGKFDELINRK